MSVGDRIKRVRNFRGLTQRELGIRAGFDERTADVRINQYEAGLRKPKEEILTRIADALEVNYRSLYEPTFYTAEDIMYTLFEMDEHFNIRLHEVPDENWNAAWEAEHPVQELPLGVRIIPHCAFGAGHHETTSMMINALMEKCQQLKGLNVLDNGCGTGVLGIFAKRLGAEYVLAIDIDDKSVLNTQENAALNGVKLATKLGSLSSQPIEGLGTFHLLLANIHRNILLEQMPLYAQLLAPGGELWISGFYDTDCPTLLAAAEAHNLHHLATQSNGDWRMMQFSKDR